VVEEMAHLRVTQGARRSRALTGPERCRRKFLRVFPGGFRDPKYLDWERGYKREAHERFARDLAEGELGRLLRRREYREAAARAVRIESRTNLLFSFEKMALRDAVRPSSGARAFAEGLWDLVYGPGDALAAFGRWTDVVAALPRPKTRVLTWPLTTVFGFLARPDRHFFLKPMVTRRAAEAYGKRLDYDPRPNAKSYGVLLEFVHEVRRDLRDLRPRDLIDIQSFLWVQGSEEYD
jgi:hypothetical protein